MSKRTVGIEFIESVGLTDKEKELAAAIAQNVLASIGPMLKVFPEQGVRLLAVSAGLGAAMKEIESAIEEHGDPGIGEIN